MKTHNLLRILVPVLLVVPAAVAEAQVKQIHGKVTDSETQVPVEYAYILNFSRQQQIYCNSKGEFRINAEAGDTLVLYALGYDYKKVVVDEEMIGGETSVVKLNHQSYDLNEARILGFGSYYDFREKFVNLERPVTQTEQLNKDIAQVSQQVAIQAYSEAMTKQSAENGVTLMRANIYTPEEIERMKLAKIIEKEKVKDQVYHKFNPMMVKQITGLTDDDEIIEFMVYCKFTDAYIIEVSEYDLSARIALKFEMFKKYKEDQKSMENPVNYLDNLMYIQA
ncbi:MAG TPA: carboxypeptidase-like regulatory domain-containing protein [Bacteroidales bacterium]|nr:carboxypeptidase-like regulatory domain-containing protein [Bacteroidales bacterium]